MLPEVTVAAGYGQRLNRAAGSVRVITREDIEQMGATTLEQVLQTVPGIHVSTTRGFRTTFVSRGIVSQNNSDFLIKINDVPIRDVISGGRPTLFSMPVRNIDHIEIVLGPGSLVHGSDAIGGIVNIVTLTGSDLISKPLNRAGTRITGYGGSLNTFGGSIVTGGESQGMEYVLALEAETTQGSDRRIGQDAQTAIDRMFGLSASRAPGRIQQDKTQFHLQGEVDFSKLKVRGGFRAFEAGSGTGVFMALSPQDSIIDRMGNLDLEYSTEMWPSVKSRTVFSYRFHHTDMNAQALPPSLLIPEGLLHEGRLTDHQFLLENTWLVETFSDHKLHLGVGSIVDWVEESKLSRNFLVQGGSVTFLPAFKELRDVPGADDPTRNRRRRLQLYAIFQDEWNFRPNWYVTYGARVDSYSDEKTLVSPRLALVHHFSPTWTGKLLYNRAYHVPSFVEHGFRIGRLDPEVIDMVELALERTDLRANRLGMSLFWYDLKDFIDEVPRPFGGSSFANFDLRGAGAEIWGKYRLTDEIELNGYYAFQRAVESKSDQVFGLAPRHMVFAEINYRFLPTWNLNLQAKWVGDRLRLPGDPRKPLKAYALLSLNLRKAVFRGVWLDFGVWNLLDADAREPSNDPVALPGDIPLPGRRFLGKLEVEF